MMDIRQKIQTAEKNLEQRLGRSRRRSAAITGAACFGSFLLGTGKMAAGLYSFSAFTCASALYTYGMVLAKLCALHGLLQPPQKQKKYYKACGVVLIAASLFYSAYSARLLLRPEQAAYHMYAALAIATFTFAEIGLNIRGVILERKSNEILLHAIKMINLASSLICLALTQTALLYITHIEKEGYDPSKANGCMGMLMGAAATGIGIFMIYKNQKEDKTI